MVELPTPNSSASFAQFTRAFKQSNLKYLLLHVIIKNHSTHAHFTIPWLEIDLATLHALW